MINGYSGILCEFSIWSSEVMFIIFVIKWQAWYGQAYHWFPVTWLCTCIEVTWLWQIRDKCTIVDTFCSKLISHWLHHTSQSWPSMWVSLVMVFNATVNNISVILWLLVFLMGETRVPWEKPQTCRKSLTTFIT